MPPSKPYKKRRPKAPPTTPEGTIQSTFWGEFQTRAGDLVLGFSVPNEGKRGKVATGILKAQGLRAGAADMVFLWTNADGARDGLLMEFKKKNGTQQPEQKQFEADAQRVGWNYVIVRSWQEAFRALDRAGAPLRYVLTEPGKMEKYVLRSLRGRHGL